MTRTRTSPAPFVLLDDTLSGQGSLLYAHPEAIVRCDGPETFEQAFAELDAAHRDGKHLAGFFSYELGYLLEQRLAPLLPRERSAPLIWCGIFAPPQTLSPEECDAFLATRDEGAYRLWDMQPSLDEQAFVRAVDRIRRYIADGDSYQVNYTLRMDFRFSGSAVALYRRLRQRQRVRHGAFIQNDGFSVLSLSPELFFEIDGGVITTRPMKGTTRRGDTPEEDREKRNWLRGDAKTRAENVMIVDLLRNDLGRVCRTGSVRTAELFTIETYQSLHQMTSEVSGRLRSDVAPLEVLRCLFPSGSVTGAPKLRTMEIIRELESRPRGVYTGAIGFIAPGGESRFNVAIRTVMIGPGGHAEMGLGSGIVHDSDPVAEYQESLLKGHFLSRAGHGGAQDFDLIEALRWEPGTGCCLLDEHLDRMQGSAAYFGFGFERDAVRSELEALRLPRPSKVRLSLHPDGSTSLAHEPLDTTATEMRYTIASRAVDSRDPFLYHKTTRRETYENELDRQRERCGCDEVLFVNERDEVTEGAWNNVFVARGGVLYTPPLHCGVLAGTLRRRLLEGTQAAPSGLAVEEKVLGLEDIAQAEAVYFGNSVRGLRRARRVD